MYIISVLRLNNKVYRHTADTAHTAARMMEVAQKQRTTYRVFCKLVPDNRELALQILNENL